MLEAAIELFLSQPELMVGWLIALLIAIVILIGVVMRLTANRRRDEVALSKLDKEILEARNQLQEARHQTSLSERQTENLEWALNEQKDRVEKCLQSMEQWRQRATVLDSRIAGLEADLEGRKRQIVQMDEERQSQLHRADELVRELHEAQVTLREREVTLDRERRATTEKLELLESNRDALRQEFENLANKIFEQKNEHFTKQTRTSLDALLTPFRDQIQDFRKRVDDVYTTETRDRQALRSEIKSLQDLNRQITEEASNLTRALKGDKKIQGNWGELILERVLEKSGLRKSVEYETQGSYRDKENQLLRPDVVVYLPDNRHLVVDSKVSLVAYQQWVIEEDDRSRENALKQHVEAVRTHIKTLSEKDYSQLSGLHSPDFVLLFMPIEPAFVAAFQQDENLFAEAFERKIIVVTPTTLLATLRTIENIWRYERQSQNARKIADRAGAVYDKLRVFVEAMERLGTQLHTAQGSYDSAMNTLTRGRGNLVSQANRFVELGVRVKKELPKVIMEQAEVDAEGESDNSLEPGQSEIETLAADADNQQE